MALAKATHKPTIEVVANPRSEKGITPKQEEFCRIYVCEDISQTEAAVRAGYSVKSAHAIASQLLNGQRYPHVVQRIRELKQELSKKFEVSFESHVKKLGEIRDASISAGNFAAAVAAEKSRGQAAGLYIDRKEIMHGNIDQMDKEQVMKEIERLQKEFPALQVNNTDAVLIESTAVDVTKQDK
jgi:phage terminase small subunit|tara:strand:+ start:452 stop:1003 length:552 start_codon:yes stop_codon:yes gene_type:complete